MTGGLKSWPAKVWTYEVITPGEGSWAHHGAGLRVDLGESRTISEGSGCGTLFGVSAEAGGLRGKEESEERILQLLSELVKGDDGEEIIRYQLAELARRNGSSGRTRTYNPPVNSRKQLISANACRLL